MYYKFTFTGHVESWGQGIHCPDKVMLFDYGRFALKPGAELTEVENPTIAIEPLEGDDLASFKAKYKIPESWVPMEGIPMTAES